MKNESALHVLSLLSLLALLIVEPLLLDLEVLRLALLPLDRLPAGSSAHLEEGHQALHLHLRSTTRSVQHTVAQRTREKQWGEAVGGAHQSIAIELIIRQIGVDSALLAQFRVACSSRSPHVNRALLAMSAPLDPSTLRRTAHITYHTHWHIEVDRAVSLARSACRRLPS